MAQSPLQRYLQETRGPLAAAALTLPLLVLHGAGATLAPEVRNGADVVSVALSAAFAAAGVRDGPLPWLGFYAAALVVQLGVALWLRHKGALSPRWLLPLLAECAAYAVIAGVISSVMTHYLLDAVASRLASTTAAAAEIGAVDAVLVSFGAGFHEELVFRAGGLAGIGRLWLGKTWRTEVPRMTLLLVIGALVFSAAHHIVEPFAIGPFVFRTAMGLLFGGLFLLRGFAVAAWTHALYDIWVLLGPSAGG